MAGCLLQRGQSSYIPTLLAEGTEGNVGFYHFITRKLWLAGVCKEQVDSSSSWVKDDTLKFVLRSVEANLRVEP